MTATDAGRRRGAAARLTGLYAITPDLDDTDRLVALARAALRGGASALQYRHKPADLALRRAQAHALAAACREHHALLIVNDDARIAADVGADGVHVGEDDGDLRAVRGVVGPHALIGASCYDDLARARALAAAGADYLAFGSLFPSAVKPQARRASLALVGEARALGLPIVGIGGIDATNARSVIAAGAQAVAVITAVFAVAEPAAVERAAARICAALGAGRTAPAPQPPE